MIDSAGERGRNRTFNLLMESMPKPPRSPLLTGDREIEAESLLFCGCDPRGQAGKSNPSAPGVFRGFAAVEAQPGRLL
jgi:hypothetical protein